MTYSQTVTKKTQQKNKHILTTLKIGLRDFQKNMTQITVHFGKSLFLRFIIAYWKMCLWGYFDILMKVMGRVL